MSDMAMAGNLARVTAAQDGLRRAVDRTGSAVGRLEGLFGKAAEAGARLSQVTARPTIAVRDYFSFVMDRLLLQLADLGHTKVDVKLVINDQVIGAAKQLRQLLQGLGGTLSVGIQGGGGSSEAKASASASVSMITVKAAPEKKSPIDAWIDRLVRIGEALKLFGEAFNAFGDGFKGISEGLQGIGEAFKGIGAGIGDGIKSIGAGIGDGLRNIGDGIGSIGDGIKGIGAGLSSIGDGIKGIGDGIGSIGDGIKGIGDGFSSIGEGIKGIGAGLSSIGDGIKGIGAGIRSFGEGIKAVGEGCKSFVESFKSISQNLNSIFKSIADSFKSVATSVKSMVECIKSLKGLPTGKGKLEGKGTKCCSDANTKTRSNTGTKTGPKTSTTTNLQADSTTQPIGNRRTMPIAAEVTLDDRNPGRVASEGHPNGHPPASSRGRLTKLFKGGSKLLKGAGRAIEPIGIGMAALDVITSENKAGAAIQAGAGVGGAALGAALGSAVLPVFGTAIGGMVGGWLGDKAGSFIANKWFSGKKDPAEAVSKTSLVPEGRESVAYDPAQAVSAMSASQLQTASPNKYEVKVDGIAVHFPKEEVDKEKLAFTIGHQIVSQMHAAMQNRSENGGSAYA